MNKSVAKKIVAGVGVPIAEEVLASSEQLLAGHVMKPPYVVKPVDEGSSVGVRIVQPGDNCSILSEDSWIYGGKVMVEKFIPGRELTVGCAARSSFGCDRDYSS
jgi:D-alanine-D-alanine ligase